MRISWPCAAGFVLLITGCGATTVGSRDAGFLDAAALDASAADAQPSCAVRDSSTDRFVLSPPDGAPYVVELAVGDQLHQCARMSDGTVRCRGFNSNGELGLGPGAERTVDTPVAVPGLQGVEQVVTAIGVTCSRHRDGTVRCWGSNEYDMLGTGHGEDENCTSGSDPRPCRTRPTLVSGLSDVVQLVGAHFSLCAVRQDGRVWCWGRAGVLLPRGGSSTPVRAEQVSEVTALWDKNQLVVARLRSGRYWSSGWPMLNFAIPPEAEIADGHSAHVCYRLLDTSVRCAGLNANGKVGNGSSLWPGHVADAWDPGLCGVRSIATGTYHTCAVMEDSTVRCWGDASHGGLGTGDLATEQCAGINHPTDCFTRPTIVPGLDRVERLFLGVWGSCALRDDHSVWCWGTLASDRRSMVPERQVW